MDDGVKSMLKVSFKNYDENLENILKFMYPLWHEVYKEIIPEKQIDFLLHKYFDVENIRTYIKDNYIYYYTLDKKLYNVESSLFFVT